MGNKESLQEEKLEAYQDCTFFNRKDILRVFKRFNTLASKRPNDGSPVKLSRQTIENMTELKENPFKLRICQVFSGDDSGDMTFEEFLDMFSVFSETAPREIKSAYAFKIYDYDGDNHLGRSDLENIFQALTLTTKHHLKPEEMKFVVDKVLEETDLDDDGMLSYIEFEHVISRAPDFITTFHIRI